MYVGRLLDCSYVVAKVPGSVARVLLRYLGRLLGGCYAVATLPRVARQGVAMRLLRYPEWLLGSPGWFLWYPGGC